MMKKKIAMFSLFCVGILLLFIGCNKKQEEIDIDMSNEASQNVINKLINKTWYAQKETENFYTGNLTIIFKDNGIFNLYDFEGDNECMNGTYILLNENEIEFNCKSEGFSPPDIWKCSQDSVFSYNFLSDNELELIYNDISCKFIVEDESENEIDTEEQITQEVEDVKLEDSEDSGDSIEAIEEEADEKANEGLEGEILDMLIFRTYINETNKILIEFLDDEMKVYKIKDCLNVFDENNNIIGDLLYNGKLSALEKKSEFYYDVDGKKKIIKYEIFKEDVSVITLEYDKKRLEFQEVYVPLG